MRKPADKKRQIFLWILSLVVVIGMICPLVELCGTRRTSAPATLPARVFSTETPAP